ncbi:MAG: plasmid partitioning protein RepB C-terminal domain-containing protein [Pirellulaceae bacterium]
MNPKTPAIRMVPIADITILNPRSRNKRIFQELVISIKNLGLKKPITVAERADSTGYDLVCGQGRLEAFIALGQSQIPAVVVEASQEDCFVMSLVENLARRQHSPLELLRNIGDLRQRGYSVTEIARKTDFSDEYVSTICYLLDHGEERLLVGVERGIIPPSIALEIARAKDGDVQVALAEAYERKALPGNQVMTIRRIIDQRNAIGKSVGRLGVRAQSRAKKAVTADSLVRAYRKEVDRQKLVVKKANVTQRRLLFVVNGLRRLLADEHFATLLRAEGMITIPKPIAERLDAASE